MTAIGPRLDAVRSRIAAACDRAGRDPSGVRLVAVSKTIPAESIVEARRAGQETFGENRVQEALGKMDAVGPGAVWHLIGHLQRNKARLAAGAFELIHSVDDAGLASELDRRAASRGIVQRVLVQANLAREETKHGVDEEGLLPLIEAVAGCAALDLRGLMIIPPPVDDAERARPWFRRLRALRDTAQERLGRALPELSMGMTDDFEVAVEEGATLVRVGRAIFGDRS